MVDDHMKAVLEYHLSLYFPSPGNRIIAIETSQSHTCTYHWLGFISQLQWLVGLPSLLNKLSVSPKMSLKCLQQCVSIIIYLKLTYMAF